MLMRDQSQDMAKRLFARLAAAYGSHKVATMWADADPEIVRETWAAALSRFSEQSIRAALGDLIASGEDWPPTLPRFVEMCRIASLRRAQSRPAAALPAPQASREMVGRAMTAVSTAAQAKPGRAWADVILARVQRGDAVSPAVIDMAMRAKAAPMAR